MSRKSLKYLHLADLHLDQPLFGGRLGLPYEKAKKRERECREVLAEAVALAQREAVEIILIAGDLWEEDNLHPDTVPFVFDTLGRAGLPVVIAPGNHDYYSPVSHYSDDITRARFGRSWPENVHIFRDYDFSHLIVPGLEGVSVTGLAYRSNQPVQLRRLGERLQPPDADIRICVVHGTREDDIPPGKMRTLPFTDSELLAQPFDYIALGHFHTRAEIFAENGKIRATYPGSPFALAADETGAHGVLVGTITSGGVAPAELAFYELDPRRIIRLKVDISGLEKVDTVESRIMLELTKAGLRSVDIALVELAGSFPTGNRIPFSEKFLQEACWHLRMDTTGVRQEWELEEPTEGEMRTTEGLFRVRLKKLIAEAATRGDEAETARLQNALYYGLDALHGLTVSQR